MRFMQFADDEEEFVLEQANAYNQVLNANLDKKRDEVMVSNYTSAWNTFSK